MMKAKCREIRALLAVPSVNWSSDEGRRVEAHLATCPDCAALARTYAEQDRLLRRVPGACLTSAQRSQLLSRIRQERGRIEMQIKLSRILGAAATLVVIIAISLGARLLLRNGYPAVDNPPISHPTVVAESTEAALTNMLKPTTLPTTTKPTPPSTTVPLQTSVSIPSYLFFETILKPDSGPILDLHLTESPTLIKIETRDELVDFWSQSQNFKYNAVPLIDFEKEVVLVLVAGAPTSGYSVEIESLEDTNGEIVVKATMIYPGRSCYTLQVNTMPFHIVKTVRSDKPYSLSLTEIPYDCETSTPPPQTTPTLSCGDVIPGQYIVIFKEDVFPGGVSAEGETVRQAAERLTSEFSGELLFVYEYTVVGFAARLPAEAVPELEQRPEVDYVSQDTTGCFP